MRSDRAQFSRPEFSRHDFVHLAADWRDREAGPRSESCAEQIEQWRSAGHPFVVTRRLPEDEPRLVRLGLATPAKARVGFAVDKAAISAHQPPPRLSEVAGVLPPDWRHVVGQLLTLERERGVALRVYGSAAWQYLSGLTYLRPNSDLDLVLACGSGTDALVLATALAHIEGKPRLDGEIVLPDGSAVAWRELAQKPERVLVKLPTGATLRPLAEIVGAES